MEKNTSLTKTLLSKGWKFIKTGNTGSALFKLDKFYLTYYRSGMTKVMDNKSNSRFEDYLKTEEDIDKLIENLRNGKQELCIN